MNAAAAAFMFLTTFGFTLNPDGSGKVAIEITASSPSGQLDDAGRMPEVVKGLAQRMIQQVQGADAWSDISVGTTAEGLPNFKGTAYFKDLGKLNFHGLMLSGFVPPTFSKDAKGDMVLTMPMGDPALPVPAPPKMTDEELAKAVETTKARWKEALPRAEAMQAVTGNKCSYSFKLPGAAEVSGFGKAADGSLLFEFDRSKMAKAAIELMANEAYIRSTLKAGLKLIDDPRDAAFMEKAFGSKGPWMARVTGKMKPQFDYQAEVKAAKEAWPKMAEKLGLPAPHGETR
jgi:hypothetical protein